MGAWTDARKPKHPILKPTQNMKKKRYYKDYDVFGIGRGLYQAHEADGKYWVKEPIAPGGECYSCCFRNNLGKGACTILACHADEREDGKDVVFERI